MIDDLNNPEDLKAYRLQRGKGRGQPIIIDGVRFSSETEGRYYTEVLKPLFLLGEIVNLEFHPAYTIAKKRIDHLGRKLKEMKYTPDFRYTTPEGRTVVVEVKAGKWVRGKLKILNSRDFPVRSRIFQDQHPELDYYIVVLDQKKEWNIL